MISKLDPIMNQSLYNEATISTLSSEPSGLEVKANPKTFRQESKLEAMMNRSLHDEAANSTLTSEPFGQEFKENLETSSKESKLITIMNQSLNNEAANTTLTSEPSCLEFKLLTKIYQRKNIFEERRQSIEKIQKDMNDEKKDQILRLIDEKTQLK